MAQFGFDKGILLALMQLLASQGTTMYFKCIVQKL
jgi:hypothetical protein